MPKQKHKQTRQLAIILIIFAIIVASSILFIRELWFEQRAQKVSIHNALDKTVERESVIKDYLDQSEDYLLFLRQSKVFNNYLDNFEKAPELQEFFLSYMTANPYFMRIRYVDASGDELIRVERNAVDGMASIISTVDPESISDQYYFTEPLKNGLEQIWYSTFDLNTENDTVTTPYQPTFRAVLPIDYNGSFDGLLIINFFVDDFINKLTNNPLYDTILYDDNGGLIYHYQENDANSQISWGNLLSREDNLANEFPDRIKKILNSHQLETDTFVSHHFEVPIYGGLNMMLQLKASYLIGEQERKIRENTTIFVMVLLFSSLLTFLIIKLFSRTLLNLDELQRLTDTIKSATRIAKIGFWELDPINRKIQWNEGIADIYNQEQLEDFNFSTFMSYLTPEDQKILDKTYNDSVAEKRNFSITHKLFTADHQVKYVEQRGQHYYRKNGQHIKTIGSVYDVTDKYFADKKYEIMLNNASNGILFMNLNGDLIEFNKKALSILGYTADEIKKLQLFDIDKDMTPALWKHVTKNLKKRDREVERVYLRKDQSDFFVYVSATRFQIGNETYVYSTFRDITQLKKTQKELEDSQRRWQFAIEGNKDGLWDWNIETGEVFLSEQLKKMIGYEGEELKDSMQNWQKLIHPDDLEACQQSLQKYFNGEVDNYSLEYRVLSKSGKYIWIRDKAVIVERFDDGRPKRLIGTHTDISDYVKAMELIKMQSYVDELTQLYNRKAYNERVAELLEQFNRYDFIFSLMMFDIDHFKHINDNYGHDKGDDVLSNLGKLLKDHFRKNDYIYRIGGEEFIILLSGTYLKDAEIIADKVRKKVNQNLAAIVDLPDPVTISIGVVTVKESDTTDTIFKRADLCLYQAKESGRNKVISENISIKI